MSMEEGNRRSMARHQARTLKCDAGGTQEVTVRSKGHGGRG
jgi:hypothetical protein